MKTTIFPHLLADVALFQLEREEDLAPLDLLPLVLAARLPLLLSHPGRFYSNGSSSAIANWAALRASRFPRYDQRRADLVLLGLRTLPARDR